MNATIDIVTPSGKSLEGFPSKPGTEHDSLTVYFKSTGECNITRRIGLWEHERVINLHPKDKIIIEIGE